MVFRIPIIAFVLTCLSLPVFAQAQDAGADFGGDKFLSGGTVIVDQTGIDDLFAAGATVRMTSDIAGSAYLAGRTVQVTGAVGGDAFLAGLDVALDGPVAGDATLAGNNVTISDVGGDLRASGGTVTVEGSVAGYAILAGDDVRLRTVISGDVHLAARNVDFGDDARVDGRLVVFENEVGNLEVPDSVVPEDRIERRDLSEWESAVPAMAGETWRSLVGSFLLGALVLALLASLIAAVTPEKLAQLRRGLLDQPLRNLWFGFLAESAIIGSAVLFATTLIGLLLVPASLFLVFAVGFAGYVVAVYSFGVGLLMQIGRPEPDSIGTRVLAAATGALVVSLIALIPFFGWLFVLALVLAGVGAITLRLFQPGFYVGGPDGGTG